jgi:CshA-type fibril repeat protein
VNAQNELVEDIGGNDNATDVTPEELNSITGVSGARPGVDYASVLQSGTYIDDENPTIAEIQAVIDSENSRLPKDDKSNDNELLSSVTVNVLANDPTGLLDVATIQITGTQNPGDPLVVEGEGTWSISVDGEIIFTPEADFEYDPTDINYTVENTDGERAVQAVVNINYVAQIRDDNEVVSFANSVTVDVLKNDNGDLNVSSVQIVITVEYRALHPDAVLSGTVTADGFFKTGDESGQQLVVPGEGTWWVNSDGTIGYKAETGSDVVNPTPISYKVYDNSGNELSADGTTITLKSTAVGGVSEVDDYLEASDSVATFSNIGLGLVALLGTIFGLFFFRKEKLN